MWNIRMSYLPVGSLCAEPSRCIMPISTLPSLFLTVTRLSSVNFVQIFQILKSASMPDTKTFPPDAAKEGKAVKLITSPFHARPARRSPSTQSKPHCRQAPGEPTMKTASVISRTSQPLMTATRRPSFPSPADFERPSCDDRQLYRLP